VWKKALIGLATLLVVAGGVLAGVDYFGKGGEVGAGSAPAASRSGSTGVTPDSLVPSSPPILPGGGSTEEEPQGDAAASSQWSPALFKLGFSFFVGLAIGMALRIFFKVSLIFIGLFALGLFGLSYAGVVDVDWASIEGAYDSIVARLSDEATSFRTFVAGSLPAAGMAGLGLFTGLKRK
jgi:uncharacterized membrane protein (Fun14 family)